MNAAAHKFWNWFKQNNKAYLFLDSVDESIKEKLLEDFLTELHQYCDKLYFEIGGFPDEEMELIITAEGNSEYFSTVDILLTAAPKIDGWKYIPLKQPTIGHFKSKWDDLELDTEDLRFVPLENDESNGIGIRVYIPNYDLIKDSENLAPLLYKMIDTIVGERSFALDVEYIEMDQRSGDPEEEDLFPIIELPEYIEWQKIQSSR